MSTRNETGTVIIGAGAAGLAAAAELASGGHDVTVLEARGRLGGRILTLRSARTPVPLELGAEFIHGTSPVLLDRLKASNDAAIDTGGDRWTARTGKLRRADVGMKEVIRVLARLPSPDRDLPFGEFLERHRRSVPPAVAQFARLLVEGFDASDIDRISTRAVLAEWQGPASADAPTFRPERGYGALVQAMRDALPKDRARVLLDTVVHSIRWRRGGVVVEARRQGEPLRIEAARAIVSLPLGVLQQPDDAPTAVRFTPALDSRRRALAQLASGPAIKVVMTFARPFWDELERGRYRDAAFFFAPQAPVPTFWTSLPRRSSVLVAWCAGSRAARLSGQGRDAVIATVLKSLRAVFGRRRYAAMLDDVAWHDWQADACARGAYSYVTAGGGRARRALAEPLEDTLYFAGEACDTTGEAATVGGALQSGLRAARRVLEA